MYRAITIWDTSIATRNVGDEIIMDAVNLQTAKIAPTSQIFRVPTHNYLTIGSYKCLRESEFSIVGGSNLLSSNMPFYQQWNLLPFELLFSKDIVLLGVGWWQYQKNPNWYTRLLLQKALSAKFLHSARDSYTVARLKSIGIKNAINTGCPTTWALTPEHCASISEEKSSNVIYTLTDYARNADADLKTLKILRQNYSKVKIWLQGSRDYEYLQSLGADGFYDELIPPQLNAYDIALAEKDCEYVGTRLHAGIRALQQMKRSLVIAVDNRAIEKSKDMGLHVIKRSELEHLQELINCKRATNLRIPFDKIDEWKNQFS